MPRARGPAGLGLAVALLAAAAGPAAGPLRFDSELIRLEVRGDTLRVEGFYRYLASNRREATPLVYPFPVDSLLGKAWPEAFAWRPAAGLPWQPVSATGRPGLSGRILVLPADPSERPELRAVYAQLLLTNYARYIVTTTQAWGEPLREARFELTLPPGMQLTESSFPFVREGKCWVFETTDFMPAVDIIVRWGPAAPAARTP